MYVLLFASSSVLSYTPSVRPSIPLPTGAIPSTSQPRKNKRQTRTDTRNLNNSLPPSEIGSVVCQVPGPRVGKYYYLVQPTVCGAKAWLVSILLWLKGTVTAGTSLARELLLTLEKKKSGTVCVVLAPSHNARLRKAGSNSNSVGTRAHEGSGHYPKFPPDAEQRERTITRKRGKRQQQQQDKPRWSWLCLNRPISALAAASGQPSSWIRQPGF
jgi:hypothetical protein